MTLKQLASKVADLERELAELRREIRPLRPLASVDQTFGMFSNDAEFDEVVKLGRAYRDQANSEGD